MNNWWNNNNEQDICESTSSNIFSLEDYEIIK